MTTQADLDAAHELELFAINDGDLYRQVVQPNIRNIARKIVKDTYDLAKARKAWQNVADAAARSYNRQFGIGKGVELFDKPTRIAAALSISFHYVDEMNETVDALRATTMAVQS